MKFYVDLKEKGYDIILEHGVLSKVNDYVDLHRKVLIISDSGVPQTYIQHVKSQCPHALIHIVQQGEASKSFPVVIKISELLLQHSFSRKDCIIALGGGMVGDVAGFVASTYMRGIDFIQIPTTTLSQIDSSIGGKVAINLGQVKNVIGSFYQPTIVLIDPDTLQTLPKRHYVNGLVEALKAGLIYDASLVELFEKGDIYSDLDIIIEKALCVKKAVVEQDETEQHVRKILNFGHTIGHAIESYYSLSTYLHGECVALGMLYFIEDEALKKRVYHIYNKLNLPTDVPYDLSTVYTILCKDKKASHAHITLVKVAKIGEAYLVEVPLEEVKNILKG